MVMRILESVQVQPEHAVLVGDSTNDVRAAKAAGVKSCAVGYGYGNRQKVAALEPDYFCETPEDLLKIFVVWELYALQPEGFTETTLAFSLKLSKSRP